MELRSGKTLCSCPKTWSSIPDDILTLIAGKIICMDDYVRFSSVCRSWYIFATETYDTSNHELNLVPLFMSVTNLSNRITVRNPASDAKLVLDLPEIADRRIWGTPLGWLITFDRTGLSFSLLNPFTGATIPLPRLPKSPLWNDNPDKIKAFLTASPDSNPVKCLVVMVSTHSQIVFTRPHRHSRLWSPIRDRFDLIGLAYHKGNLYGLESSSSSLLQFRLNRRTKHGRVVPRVVKFLTLNLTLYTESYKHILDFNGHLCIHVHRDLKLLKIDISTGELTGIPLGNRYLVWNDYFAFSYKTTYPLANFLKQHLHDQDCSFRVEIRDVYGSIMNLPNPLCNSFWTVPFIK